MGNGNENSDGFSNAFADIDISPPPSDSSRSSSPDSTENSDQIDLWVFLMELLVDKDYLNFIQWKGTDGEFKFINPEAVAALWGQRKGDPSIDYNGMARELHWYDGGEIIWKVRDEQHTYKFMFDLKKEVGKNAKELSDMVNVVRRPPPPRRYPNGYPYELDSD